MASFELVLDVAGSDYHLFQGHTEESVNLGKGPVELNRSPCGAAYVATREWSKWAEDFFGQQVVTKDDNSLWVVWPETKKSMPLVDYQQAHAPIRLGLVCWGVAAVQHFAGFFLHHRVQGQAVLGLEGHLQCCAWHLSFFASQPMVPLLVATLAEEATAAVHTRQPSEESSSDSTWRQKGS